MSLPLHVYDLVVLLQQAAQDADRYRIFAEHAEAAGDHEFAAWCRQLADSDEEITERARRKLAARL